MLRLRTAFATFALIVGFGSTSQAQMFNPGMATFGMNGFQGGYGGFQMGFGGQPLGAVGGAGLMMGPMFPYGNGYGYGYGYGVPYYPVNRYYAPVPQTYNAMGSLIDSIESSTSSRDSWRRWPR